MLNAVGIDVSKGRSTVAVLQPGGVVIHKPFDVSHNSKDLHDLAHYLVTLDGETRVVMESTGRYHEPILTCSVRGRPVCQCRESASDQKILAITLSAKSRQIQLMRRKSPATRLTTGLLCVNIQLWIPLVQN